MYSSVWFTDKRILLVSDLAELSLEDYVDGFEAGLGASEVGIGTMENPDIIIVGNHSNQRAVYERRHPTAMVIEERELDIRLEELQLRFVDIVDDVLTY